ncbi:hypothetical protein GOBAR_AA30556 [Gossypium barbadense]|uniref:Uncharacterized protein n=1 Tax=Gossypium barbadense TaxID=3634 RepID=A0A2P5WGE2_GOSBA|nr:hypothetical protein GOBAR_AA30556 [Gossypium barbadense]
MLGTLVINGEARWEDRTRDRRCEHGTAEEKIAQRVLGVAARCVALAGRDLPVESWSGVASRTAPIPALYVRKQYNFDSCADNW